LNEISKKKHCLKNYLDFQQGRKFLAHNAIQNIVFSENAVLEFADKIFFLGKTILSTNAKDDWSKKVGVRLTDGDSKPSARLLVKENGKITIKLKKDLDLKKYQLKYINVHGLELAYLEPIDQSESVK